MRVGATVGSPTADDIEDGCVSLCSRVYSRAWQRNVPLPLSGKLENGRARTWPGGLHRGPDCAKAIPQGRGGARLLSISVEGNAGFARSSSRDENRNEEILPRAFSYNG